MSTLEFQPFPKIARLNRDITITEKLDGTNAAVVIVPTAALDYVLIEKKVTLFDVDRKREIARVMVDINENGDWEIYSVFAQSRSRFITPDDDNYGFAAWVKQNAQALVDTLGEGTHFGEWWGAGIQRGYGLPKADKRFSLFNIGRWSNGVVWHGDSNTPAMGGIPGLGVVPIIFRGVFSSNAARNAIELLRDGGSFAAPGFMRPEGIVVWHEAARQSFKVTLEGDEAPKGQAAHALDEEIAA